MKKIRILRWIIGSAIFMAGATFAQRSGNFGDNMPSLSLSGTIIDSVTQQPLEYATVILISARDDQQVNGTITDKDGKFNLTRLRPGEFRLKIDFIGYESRSIGGVRLSPRRTETDLGLLFLIPAVLESEGVEVSAEKPEFEYQIDKKVINVSQQPTVISGTAVDVLENVPSITTDIEGNVQLRGSGNFTVLIDNRPSVLESNDALQQIPASTIESIEIITNPSAKFDPEGTAGIINVITKKNQKTGITGVVNANIGNNGRNGGDFLLSKRTKLFNFFFGADYNIRKHPRDSEVKHRTTYNDTVHYIYSEGEGDWGGNGFGVRGGFDYSMTNRDLWTLSFRAGSHNHDGDSKNSYDEWTEPGGEHNLYVSSDENKRGGNYYSVNLDYKHDFEKKGHELLGAVNISDRSGDEKSVNILRDENGDITHAQRFTEKGPSGRLRLKLDYTLPLRESDKFQLGLQSRIHSSDDETERYDYQLDTRVYELQPLFSHLVKYTDTFHAVYSMYAADFDRFGIQGGVRAEYTDREITLKESGESYLIDQWDFFPTLHASYKFTKGQQMMASYTRRIDRPRGWELEPFETWMDAYNVRKGNPGLKPEYIDSYEMGYQTFWGRNIISLEGYYRVTNNKVERVRSVDNELYGADVTLQTTENVGKDYTFGAELMTNVDLSKWWNVNLMGTVYHYKVEGMLFGSDFSRDSRSWNLRFNNTFKLTGTTRLQLTGRYNSPSVSSQGRREDFYVLDMGLRQEFFKRALNATLQVRDLFNTAEFRNSSSGPNFETNSIFRRSRMVMLTLTWNINNYKQERDRENGDENGNSSGMIEGGNGGEGY
ncbi:TonB-dependent receptor [bacterium]|nr:TonB-dependent receptor [bacterium]